MYFTFSVPSKLVNGSRSCNCPWPSGNGDAGSLARPGIAVTTQLAWVQEQIPRHVECTAAAIEILSVARKLERIGDLCTNIAEEVILAAESVNLKHAEKLST